MVGVGNTDHLRGRNACLKGICLRRDGGLVVCDEGGELIGVVTIKGPEAMRIRVDGEHGRIDMRVFLMAPAECQTNRGYSRRAGGTRRLQRNGPLYSFQVKLKPGCSGLQPINLLRVLKALRKKQIELTLLIDCIDGNFTNFGAVESIGIAAVQIDETGNQLRIAAADRT